TKKDINGEIIIKDSKMKIEKEWEIISSAILKAAMKHIPWINVKKTEAQVKTS
ncbi:16665_t:CDS:1, partial [Gigaspora rosea]